MAVLKSINKVYIEFRGVIIRVRRDSDLIGRCCAGGCGHSTVVIITSERWQQRVVTGERERDKTQLFFS